MPRDESQPAVIVDFIFDEGLLFISIRNISDAPAYNVSVEFDKKITGVDGIRDIGALPLFRKIGFLAPQKEIVAFLDASASYFQRQQPAAVQATITHRDASGKAHKAVIKHDLRIYREIGYVPGRTPSRGAKPAES